MHCFSFRDGVYCKKITKRVQRNGEPSSPCSLCIFLWEGGQTISVHEFCERSDKNFCKWRNGFCNKKNRLLYFCFYHFYSFGHTGGKTLGILKFGQQILVVHIWILRLLIKRKKFPCVWGCYDARAFSEPEKLYKWNIRYQGFSLLQNLPNDGGFKVIAQRSCLIDESIVNDPDLIPSKMRLIISLGNAI